MLKENYDDFSDKQKEIIFIFRKFVSSLDPKLISVGYNTNIPSFVRNDNNERFYLRSIINHISFMNGLSSSASKEVELFAFNKSYWVKAEADFNDDC